MIQVRKMFVYLMLLVAFSALGTLSRVKWVALGWMAIGTLTAGRGLVQFWRDVLGARAEHRDFYTYSLSDRIRGFMSHWMTFSGQEMFILVILASFVLFARDVRRRLWLAVPCAAAVGLALVLSDTRSVWIASVGAVFYLLWVWNRWAAVAMPALLLAGLIVAPKPIQERAMSIVKPKKQTDSNEHRIVCWRTGWQMIKAHPIAGVGPEEVSDARVFDRYVPDDIPRPLPDGWYGHLHNVYIQYAAERGVPAALFIAAALAMPLIDLRRALQRLAPGRSDARFILNAAIASIIGAALSGIFEHNLGDTEVLTMFLVILCSGYVAAERKRVAVEETAPVAA
jgi:O-antigen ligase